MKTAERVGQRDRRVSTVRRVTIWVSAGSLAVAGGIGAVLGIGQAGAAGSAPAATSTASTDATTGSTSGSESGGFTQPTQAPGTSDGPGSVTSGGS